jgi:hypothetical protein
MNEYLRDFPHQPEPGQVAFYPVVDAIQDPRRDTVRPPSSAGSMAVVNLTTKSGGNAFRGNVFEFFATRPERQERSGSNA